MNSLRLFILFLVLFSFFPNIVLSYPPNWFSYFFSDPCQINLGDSVTIRGRVSGYYPINDDLIHLSYRLKGESNTVYIGKVKVKTFYYDCAPVAHNAFSYKWQPPRKGEFHIIAEYEEPVRYPKKHTSECNLIVKSSGYSTTLPKRRIIIPGPSDIVSENFSLGVHIGNLRFGKYYWVVLKVGNNYWPKESGYTSANLDSNGIVMGWISTKGVGSEAEIVLLEVGFCSHSYFLEWLKRNDKIGNAPEMARMLHYEKVLDIVPIKITR